MSHTDRPTPVYDQYYWLIQYRYNGGDIETVLRPPTYEDALDQVRALWPQEFTDAAAHHIKLVTASWSYLVVGLQSERAVAGWDDNPERVVIRRQAWPHAGPLFRRFDVVRGNGSEPVLPTFGRSGVPALPLTVAEGPSGAEAPSDLFSTAAAGSDIPPSAPGPSISAGVPAPDGGWVSPRVAAWGAPGGTSPRHGGWGASERRDVWVPPLEASDATPVERPFKKARTGY